MNKHSTHETRSSLQRFSELESIFWQALQLTAAPERRAFLDDACSGNADLRKQVEALLGSIALADQFAEAYTPTIVASPDEYLGTTLGPYKLREKIGEGGMGIVYAAEQKLPLKRRVALKIIKPGMDSRQIIARFESERETLALMDHPHIARVLDAGTTDRGLPYFVMELVRGVPITEFADKQRLTLDGRLKLFQDVCHAVQHAHMKGIIHRDIKPSNVLVTLHDGKPVVKVIDFGVAKAMGRQFDEHSVYTALGQMVGTPMYMSPEQAELSGLDVDTRSDVYSLGVLLYELLTGMTPFDRVSLREAGFDAMLRIIREQEPPKPSLRLNTVKNERRTTVADSRRVDVKRLCSSLRGELDWIVMKALEKDRSLRYQSASYFSADIERHLKSEPVIASPPTPFYRFRKFVRRNRQGVATAVVFLGFCFVLMGVVGWIVRDRAAQQSVVQHEVDAMLQDVELLLEAGRPRAALSAVERATSMLVRLYGNPDLRARVNQRHKDVQLVLRLEDIRLEESAVDPAANIFDRQRTVPLYDQAFREFGFDLNEPNKAIIAKEIRKRPKSIKTALLAGLSAYTILIRGRGQLGFSIDPETYRIIDVKPHSPAKDAGLSVGDQITGVGNSASDISSTDKISFKECKGRLAGVSGTQVCVRILSADGTASQLVTLTRQIGWHELVDISRAADDDGWRRDFWNALAQEDVDAIDALATREDLWSQPTVSFHLLQEFLETPTAINVLRRAQERYPSDFWINHTLAFQLMQLNPSGLEEAIHYYHAAIALRPESPGVRLNLGNAYIKAGDIDAAMAQYRRAIALQPDYSAAHYGLADAYWRQEKFEESISIAREVIRANPNFANSYHVLARACRDSGQLEQAAINFRKLISLEPRASDYNNLAIVLRKLGDPAGSITAFREATRLEPNSAFYLGNLAEELENQGILEEAITAWESAIDMEKNPELGWTKFHLEVNWAKSHLEKLLAQTGQWNRLRQRVWSGSIYTLVDYIRSKFTGRENEPGAWMIVAHDETLFSELRANMPNSERPWEARGCAFAIEGSWDLAAADYAKAMELIENYAPTDWWGQDTALALRIAERPEVYQRVLMLRPDDDCVKVANVRLQAVAGNWQEAADEVEKLAERHPDDQWHWHILAVLRLRCGDTSAYKLACEELLTRFSSHDFTPVQIITAIPCFLSPDAFKDREAEIKGIVEDTISRGVPSEWESLLNWLSALAAYRAADFSASNRFLSAEQQGAAEFQAAVRMLQAMIHYQEGNREAAIAAFATAVEFAEVKSSEQDFIKIHQEVQWRAIFDTLRSEAEELLKISSDDISKRDLLQTQDAETTNESSR